MSVLQQAQLEGALERALALAQALEALHGGQQVHGALEPAALELLGDGRWQLRPAPVPGPLSLERLRYASPEQAGHLAPVEARSDLYSLGQLLYHWLLGRPAFDSSDALVLAYQQIQVLPEAPHLLDAGVPQQVSHLVMRLLAKAPAARYASAIGLADDLRQCLQQLRGLGRVEPFVLGSTERQAQLVLSERLYGRQADLACLEQLWLRAVEGEVLLGLVAAEAGMGKTVLVRGLRDAVLLAGGTLVEARFSAGPQELPYSALIEALRKLLRQVWSGLPSERIWWRTRLSDALGNSLPVLMDVLPEMVWIAGPQLPAPTLTGLAYQRRLSAALMSVLCLFAGQQHPLLLFLDDLHRADAASLAFLRNLLRGHHGSHLLLLGAYRPTEVGSAQPLGQLLQEWQQGQTPPLALWLQPLQGEDVAAWLADCCGPFNALPELAQRLLRDGRGNPARTLQRLQTLVAHGHLRYERQHNSWCWNGRELPPAQSWVQAGLWWT